jgi:hypothetical protein
MSFIKKLFGLDSLVIKAEDIELFISQKTPVEENINLDYKSIPVKNINYDELAKDVSAFANSEGGLLLYGVAEKRERDPKTKTVLRVYPKEITWGNPSLKKETLEQHLVGKIHPPIDDLRIIPIRKSQQDHKVIFLIDVPKSNNAPHMATAYHKYYERFNFVNHEMGHYKVQNLFRINWTMKDKLIERIYEPLSTILRNHIKRFVDYSYADAREVEDILSKSYYYTSQIPEELLQQIDSYIENLKKLIRKEHFTQRIINKILVSYVIENIEIIYDPDFDKLDVKFQAISKKFRTDLLRIEILIFKNQDILTYLNDTYFRDPITEIEVFCDRIRHKFDVKEFNESMWKTILKEANQNIEINQFKEYVEILLNEAETLNDMIIKY